MILLSHGIRLVAEASSTAAIVIGGTLFLLAVIAAAVFVPRL